MRDEDPSPVTCSEAVRQLWDYLEGSPESVNRERVEAHLTFCRRCCGELEFIRHLRRLLESQTTDDFQPQALQRLEHFLEEL